MDKDIRKLLQAIEAAGFIVVTTRKGHHVILTEDGEHITVIAGTPSDHRSILNSIAPLKRRGFRWPPRR